MSAGAQRRGLNESAYERPGQRWVCGRAREGRPCPLGPDAAGQCVASHECKPLERGDRWHCARAAMHGGRCGAGPLPDGQCGRAIARCQPLPSWRARRGQLSLWVVSLTLGVVVAIIVWAGPAALSPGPLSARHATAGADCAHCHAAGSGGFLLWLTTAFAGTDGAAESARCTRCHDRGPYPLKAHTLPPHRLLARIRAAAFRLHGKSTAADFELRDWRVDVDNLRWGDLPCTLCHTEHRGRDFDLKPISDRRCAICHQRKFAEFSAHPALVQYPYARRTRLQFDHLSHRNKHFPRNDTRFDCGECHAPSDAGRRMSTRGFTRACAACHAAQIVDDPVPVFTVPALDVEALQARGMDVGAWPEEGADGISAYVRVLLGGDPALRRALVVVQRMDDLEDLGDEDVVSDEQLQAVAAVAWGIKKLIYDLDVGGQDALGWYLSRAAGVKIDGAKLGMLAGGLPRAALAALAEQEFPGLGEELAAFGVIASAGTRRSLPALASSAAGRVLEVALVPLPGAVESPAQWSAAGGWYYSEDEHAVLYRALGHADAFLHAWTDLAATLYPSQPDALAEIGALDAPGRCGKCHSADSVPGAGVRVNWTGARPGPARPVTRFSHAPHMSLGPRVDCGTCHVPDTQNPYRKSYAGLDPYAVAPNFEPMTLETCRRCHGAGGAGADCLDCHNYHVGDLEKALPRAATGAAPVAASPGR